MINSFQPINHLGQECSQRDLINEIMIRLSYLPQLTPCIKKQGNLRHLILSLLTKHIGFRLAVRVSIALLLQAVRNLIKTY